MCLTQEIQAGIQRSGDAAGAMCEFWSNNLISPPCTRYLPRWKEGFTYLIISLCTWGISLKQSRLRSPTQMRICHLPSLGQCKAPYMYKVCSSYRECKQGLSHTVLATVCCPWMKVACEQRDKAGEKAIQPFFYSKLISICHKIRNTCPFCFMLFEYEKATTL